MMDKPNGGPPGIDRDLELLAEGIASLRELAPDPVASEDDARVYDFSIRWGTLLSGRLKRLEHYHRAGELAAGQRRRYRELRDELKQATPLAEGLGLGKPSVPLED